MTLAAARIPAAGPLKVQVTNKNAFAVTGTVSGRTLRRVPVSSRLRRVRLPARSLAVAAQSAKTIRMAVPGALRRVLRERRRLALVMRARVTDPAGNARKVKKRVTVRLKRSR
jgi:hypothetical protein